MREIGSGCTTNRERVKQKQEDPYATVEIEEETGNKE
jgi:hypothetical protein